MYLARFGYLDPSLQNPSSGALISGDSVKKAILEFQAFAGINQTGEILVTLVVILFAILPIIRNIAKNLPIFGDFH